MSKRVSSPFRRKRVPFLRIEGLEDRTLLSASSFAQSPGFALEHALGIGKDIRSLESSQPKQQEKSALTHLFEGAFRAGDFRDELIWWQGGSAGLHGQVMPSKAHWVASVFSHDGVLAGGVFQITIAPSRNSDAPVTVSFLHLPGRSPLWLGKMHHDDPALQYIIKQFFTPPHKENKPHVPIKVKPPYGPGPGGVTDPVVPPPENHEPPDSYPPSPVDVGPADGSSDGSQPDEPPEDLPPDQDVPEETDGSGSPDDEQLEPELPPTEIITDGPDALAGSPTAPGTPVGQAVSPGDGVDARNAGDVGENAVLEDTLLESSEDASSPVVQGPSAQSPRIEASLSLATGGAPEEGASPNISGGSIDQANRDTGEPAPPPAARLAEPATGGSTPQAPGVLEDFTPFDIATLERTMEQFLDQLREAGAEVAGYPMVVKISPVFAVLGAAAVYVVCSQWTRLRRRAATESVSGAAYTWFPAIPGPCTDEEP